jgi:hypothetical protein
MIDVPPNLFTDLVSATRDSIAAMMTIIAFTISIPFTFYAARRLVALFKSAVKSKHIR